MASPLVNNLKNNVMANKKMFFFVGGAIAVVAGALVLMDGGPAADPVGGRAAVNVVPGPAPSSGNITPAYEQAIRQDDSRRIDEARSGGGSALPTIIDRPSEVREIRPSVPALPVSPPTRPDVAAPPVLAAPPPPPVQSPQNTRQNNAQQQSAAPPRLNPEVANSMSAQINAILTAAAQPSQHAVIVPINQPQDPQQIAATIGAQGASQQASSGFTIDPNAVLGSVNGDDEVPLPLPGTVLYGQMISQANSDTPGPVLARLLQGELAGATLIGEFSVAGEALIIRFTRMSGYRIDASGQRVPYSVDVDVVAVDESNLGTALATSVDNYLFERLASTFVTSFISGMGTAIAESGQTVVTTADGTTSSSRGTLDTTDKILTATGKVADETGEIFKEFYGQRPPTIIVDGGTSIGLLFLN